MKSHSQNGQKQNSRAAANHAASKNNAAAFHGVPAQFQTYSKTVTRPARPDFDKNNWPAILSAGGSAANPDIASKVNESLTTLGWAGRSMGAHMIPQRIGGVGNNSNVRPWATDFETGTWETEVEELFNNTLEAAADGAQVLYKVDTTEMPDAHATAKLGEAGIAPAHADHTKHKERLKKIPFAVSATIGGTTKGPYSPVPAGRPAAGAPPAGAAAVAPVRVADPLAHTEEHISAEK